MSGGGQGGSQGDGGGVAGGGGISVRWYPGSSSATGWVGFGGSTFELAGLGSRSIGSNWQLYRGTFRGNQYVSAWRVAPALRVVGVATAVVGVGLDSMALWTYYQDPSDPNAITPAKFGANLGMTALGFWFPVGTTIAAGYFVGEFFIPEGWGGLLGGFGSTGDRWRR